MINEFQQTPGVIRLNRRRSYFGDKLSNELTVIWIQFDFNIDFEPLQDNIMAE